MVQLWRCPSGSGPRQRKAVPEGQSRDRKRHRGPDPRQCRQAVRIRRPAGRPLPRPKSLPKWQRTPRSRWSRLLPAAARASWISWWRTKCPFINRRRPKPEEEKCADAAKARARALDRWPGRMSSGQLWRAAVLRFTEQAAAAAVAEMVELDYVNDDRYAEARAHSLLAGPKRAAAPPRTCGRRAFPARRSSRRWKASTPRTKAARDPELEAAAALVVRSRYMKAGRWPPRPCGGLPCSAAVLRIRS